MLKKIIVDHTFKKAKIKINKPINKGIETPVKAKNKKKKKACIALVRTNSRRIRKPIPPNVVIQFQSQKNGEYEKDRRPLGQNQNQNLNI